MSTCGDLNHGTYSAAPTEQSQASLDTGGPFMSLPSAFSMASTSSSSLEDEAYSALSPRAAAPGSVAQDGPPVFSAEHLGDYELINARLRPPSDRNETPSSSSYSYLPSDLMPAMQPAAAPMSAYPSSSSSGFRPQSGSSHSNSVVSPQIPQPSYQNSPASSTPSFHLLNNSSKDASTLAPYSPHPSVPVYDKFYGSSFVSVNPNMTPFTDAIGQTDDPTLDPRKRKRAVESPQNAIPFDPNSPGLPRAHTGNYPGLYSVSGFDALSVLARVMFRPSPQIQLGPIDLATAFCVVDARRTNLPIIYASESFTELTGYPNAEIIGKNCRFLQSPDGNVQQGSPRLFTDSNGVFHLRKHINSVRETQVSIVNYRKDRSPFINLISIIPITWDSDEVAYFVGFQLDLSKQPEKILQRVREGNYTVNLSVLPGAPPIEPVRAIMPPADSEQSSSSESPGSMSTGYNVEQTIIDNLPDLVFAVSVKGLFLFASPSFLKVMGYTSQELMAKTVNDICHQSDLVHVTRELKEAVNKPKSTVNITFRARKKDGQFFWLEANGRLQGEGPKGRKVVALNGRSSAVPSFARDVLTSTGGVTTSEFWHRLTPTGLCLYSCPAIERLLGMPPAGIVGQSILTLVDPSHAAEFSRSLADARGPGRGSPSAMRHSIKTQQGQWRDVITTFFPPTTPATSHNPRETLIVCQTADTEAKIAKQPEFSQLSSGQRVPFVNQNGRRRSSTNPDNVLSVLEPNRSSSWQFELGNLQRENRQLMAEIERIERIKAAAETSGRSMSTSGLGAGHLPKESDLMGPAGPMPPMSCCLNCGSSDVRPDALGSETSSLCSTCAMNWQAF